MRRYRHLVVLAGLLAAPAALSAQQEHRHDDCPSVTFSSLVANPINGEVRGTEITVAESQSGCVVLLRTADGRFGPTRVGTPMLVGDSLNFQLSGGGMFRGVVVGDTLRGELEGSGALVLRRTAGAAHVHEH